MAVSVLVMPLLP